MDQDGLLVQECIPVWFAAQPHAKFCPVCGNILRYRDVPESSVAARFVATELLLWVALGFGLAFLYAPTGSGWLYAGLGFITVAVWLRLRGRQRADGEALLERRQYLCAQCHHRFEGSALREIPSH
jgi:hypothetical protein